MKKLLYPAIGAAAAVIVLVVIIVFFPIDGGQKIMGQAETSSAAINDQSDGTNEGGTKKSAEEYYLLLTEGKVCIYRGDDKVFYDYAAVNMDSMPVEVREQLKYGLYLDNIEELYDFLQTYSS